MEKGKTQLGRESCSVQKENIRTSGQRAVSRNRKIQHQNHGSPLPLQHSPCSPAQGEGVLVHRGKKLLHVPITSPGLPQPPSPCFLPGKEEHELTLAAPCRACPTNPSKESSVLSGAFYTPAPVWVVPQHHPLPGDLLLGGIFFHLGHLLLIPSRWLVPRLHSTTHLTQPRGPPVWWGVSAAAETEQISRGQSEPTALLLPAQPPTSLLVSLTMISFLVWCC